MKQKRLRIVLLFGLAALIGIAYCFFLNLLLQALKLGSAGSVDEQLLRFFEGRQWLIILIEVVFAPVVEELLFRKLFYGKLSKVLKPILAALISSAVFGALHFSIPGAIYGFVFGLILCVVMDCCNTWIGAVIAHGFANITALLMNYVPALNEYVASHKAVFLALSIILLGLFVFLTERFKLKESDS